MRANSERASHGSVTCSSTEQQNTVSNDSSPKGSPPVASNKTSNPGRSASYIPADVSVNISGEESSPRQSPCPYIKAATSSVLEYQRRHVLVKRRFLKRNPPIPFSSYGLFVELPPELCCLADHAFERRIIPLAQIWIKSLVLDRPRAFIPAA